MLRFSKAVMCRFIISVLYQISKTSLYELNCRKCTENAIFKKTKKILPFFLNFNLISSEVLLKKWEPFAWNDNTTQHVFFRELNSTILNWIWAVDYDCVLGTVYSMNLPITLKMPWLNDLGKRPQGFFLRKPKYTWFLWLCV
jgi:hypothetical protein